ncbi:translation initiation factor IF-3 [Aneurinibacillus aneurinilyticus]|uniref:Translation initiation factor IF-3 n=2 Tax=Aneurinibacillus aneurinilyticus TaxID=1391 RepID=A0A848CYH7_ANEAE|nr:translation initiation factor IF-3 [Aneurinibacillus aneurinilyticus]ERI11699.1 translation initiation factor IF-3 [Aneurinibacillus aneurinilyticus ATCC 12856]MED0668622.1 translation initiation factor IF-3 [Aneurinibacillus aneurinilyticus]MED0708842.1 translation initiation factor IF-3 [Aneurinibacillus aneurinilyticus]MED0725347.1 translation initiation factor IF-3 [Aneurinibacillus aneurinilyticus]MED0731556.1 translation initiation factor IF-3 [Aneurinibacillus aneurinilyticus]
MLINEKIKASEVELTGIQGEDMGIMSTKEALRIAKELKVDLVCLSLASSPPPCQLLPRQAAQKKQAKEKQALYKQKKGPKTKEIRVSAAIEQHDYETKKRQVEKILGAGDWVQITVRLQRKESDAAKRIVAEFVQDLSHCAEKEKGIQMSGKQVSVVLKPR